MPSVKELVHTLEVSSSIVTASSSSSSPSQSSPARREQSRDAARTTARHRRGLANREEEETNDLEVDEEEFDDQDDDDDDAMQPRQESNGEGAPLAGKELNQRNTHSVVGRMYPRTTPYPSPPRPPSRPAAGGRVVVHENKEKKIKKKMRVMGWPPPPSRVESEERDNEHQRGLSFDSVGSESLEGAAEILGDYKPPQSTIPSLSSSSRPKGLQPQQQQQQQRRQHTPKPQPQWRHGPMHLPPQPESQQQQQQQQQQEQRWHQQQPHQQPQQLQQRKRQSPAVPVPAQSHASAPSHSTVVVPGRRGAHNVITVVADHGIDAQGDDDHDVDNDNDNNDDDDNDDDDDDDDDNNRDENPFDPTSSSLSDGVDGKLAKTAEADIEVTMAAPALADTWKNDEGGRVTPRLTMEKLFYYGRDGGMDVATAAAERVFASIDLSLSGNACEGGDGGGAWSGSRSWDEAADLDKSGADVAAAAAAAAGSDGGGGVSGGRVQRPFRSLSPGRRVAAGAAAAAASRSDNGVATYRKGGGGGGIGVADVVGMYQRSQQLVGRDGEETTATATATATATKAAAAAAETTTTTTTMTTTTVMPPSVSFSPSTEFGTAPGGRRSGSAKSGARKSGLDPDAVAAEARLAPRAVAATEGGTFAPAWTILSNGFSTNPFDDVGEKSDDSGKNEEGGDDDGEDRFDDDIWVIDSNGGGTSKGPLDFASGSDTSRPFDERQGGGSGEKGGEGDGGGGGGGGGRPWLPTFSAGDGFGKLRAGGKSGAAIASAPAPAPATEIKTKVETKTNSPAAAPAPAFDGRCGMFDPFDMDCSDTRDQQQRQERLCATMPIVSPSDESSLADNSTIDSQSTEPSQRTRLAKYYQADGDMPLTFEKSKTASRGMRYVRGPEQIGIVRARTKVAKAKTLTTSADFPAGPSLESLPESTWAEEEDGDAVGVEATATATAVAVVASDSSHSFEDRWSDWEGTGRGESDGGFEVDDERGDTSYFRVRFVREGGGLAVDGGDDGDGGSGSGSGCNDRDSDDGGGCSDRDSDSGGGVGGGDDHPSSSPPTTCSSTRLHDLIGDITSPSDPRWGEVLRMLADDPNLARISVDVGLIPGAGGGGGEEYDSVGAGGTASDPRRGGEEGGGRTAGWLPLHLACMSSPPPHIIEALVLANPDAVRAQDGAGRLPLHIAAASGGWGGTAAATAEEDRAKRRTTATMSMAAAAMHILVGCHQASVCAKDGRGMIPLHLGIRNGLVLKDLDALRILLGQEMLGRRGRKRRLLRRGEHLNVASSGLGDIFIGKELDREFAAVGTSRRERPLSPAKTGAINDISEEPATSPMLESLWKDEGAFSKDDALSKYQHLDDDTRVLLLRLYRWSVRRRNRSDGERRAVGNETGQGIEVSPGPIAYTSAKEGKNGANGDASGDGNCWVNPASIRAPPDYGFALHMAVASIGAFVTKEHSREEKEFCNDDVDEEDDDDDPTVASTPMSLKQRAGFGAVAPVRLVDTLRVLAAAHPPALLRRDARGRTPLVLALIDRSGRPDAEMVDLLLGVKDGVCRAAPRWLDSAVAEGFVAPPTDEDSEDWRDEECRDDRSAVRRYANPAMIRWSETGQLPLHVAVEDASLTFPVVTSIHGAYPSAVRVLDARGRTPLHSSLSYIGHSAPSITVIKMLLDDGMGGKDVARMKDDEGKIPFDLLVELGRATRGSEPKITMADEFERDVVFHDATGVVGVNGDVGAVFRPIFSAAADDAGILHCDSTSVTSRYLMAVDSERDFLSRLRFLHPILRRQACAVSSVQYIIFRAVFVHTPLGCFVALFQGVALAATMTVLRLSLDSISTGGSSDNTSDGRGYELALLILALYQVFVQLVCCAACTRLSVFNTQVIRSFWSWVNLCSSGLLLATGILLVSRDGRWSGRGLDSVLRVGTVSTGMLWAQISGHLSQWWYAMGRYMDTVIRVSWLLACPLLFLGLLITGFAQMLYTVEKISGANILCTNSSTSLVEHCQIREYLLAAYLQLFGTPPIQGLGVDLEWDGQQTRAGATSLVVIFTVLALVFFLGSLLLVILDSKTPSAHTAALDSYWVRMLNFYFVLSTTCCYGIGTRHSTMHVKAKNDPAGVKSYPHRRKGSLSSISYSLEWWWSLITSSYLNSSLKHTDFWYMRGARGRIILRAFSSKWKLRFLGLIVIPIWLLVGLATLGLLWPPQVRKWLFHPSKSWTASSASAACHIAPSSMICSRNDATSIRNEMLLIKAMMYEQSLDLQCEIQELKEKVNAL